MQIQFNFPDGNDYISNLAFIRALMIKKSIEDLNISYKEKEQLKNKILETLEKTWNSVAQELQSQQKEEKYHED